MKWLRRLLRRSRDPHSLDPLRAKVSPPRVWADELERRRAQLDYEPEHPFHRDQRQPRNDDDLPALLRRQAS